MFQNAMEVVQQMTLMSDVFMSRVLDSNRRIAYLYSKTNIE